MLICTENLLEIKEIHEKELLYITFIKCGVDINVYIMPKNK